MFFKEQYGQYLHENLGKLVPGSWILQLSPNDLVQNIGLDQITSRLLSLGGAIAILLLGWIIAVTLSLSIQTLLSKTDLDNRLAAWILGQKPGSDLPKVEKWIGIATFWMVMVFAIVAFLNALELDAVSQPLTNFLQQITSYAPRLLSAGILLAVAWIFATVVRLTLTQGMARFQLDDRLAQQLGSEEGQLMLPLNETLGNILYWFILLFFLPFILDALQLQGPLEPVQNLINQLLSALPNIFKAVLIGFIGWLMARFIQNIVTNFLRAVGSDRLGAQFGLGATDSSTLSLSVLGGNFIYAFVILFTAIAALQALQISAISDPAIAMLNQILTALPYILQASLIFFIFYLGAKFVANLVTTLLTGLGFNDVLLWLGLQTLVPSDSAPTPGTTTPKSPSEIAGIVAGIGVMLVGTTEAVDSLKLSQLSAIIAEITASSGKILSGLVVFALALFLGNLAFRVVSLPGDRQSKLLANAARISILVFGTAMGLRQMGIATNIVDLAFGLLFGAIAVAMAVAFGWGGKDIAAAQLQKWIDTLQEDAPPPP